MHKIKTTPCNAVEHHKNKKRIPCKTKRLQGEYFCAQHRPPLFVAKSKFSQDHPTYAGRRRCCASDETGGQCLEPSVKGMFSCESHVKVTYIKPKDFKPNALFVDGKRNDLPQCQAWSPTRGKQCGSSPKGGRITCRRHGGTKKEGPDSPSYKHGVNTKTPDYFKCNEVYDVSFDIDAKGRMALLRSRLDYLYGLDDEVITDGIKKNESIIKTNEGINKTQKALAESRHSVPAYTVLLMRDAMIPALKDALARFSSEERHKIVSDFIENYLKLTRIRLKDDRRPPSGA